MRSTAGELAASTWWNECIGACFYYSGWGFYYCWWLSLYVCVYINTASGRLRQLVPILQKAAANPSPSLHAAAFSTSYRSNQEQIIQVTPSPSLLDQRVAIKVAGLQRNAKVTLQTKTKQEWRREAVEFMSCAHFVTDEKGELDLNRDSSVGGTYTGTVFLKVH